MLHLLLYFVAIFSLSTAANFVRLAAAPVDVVGFWRLSLTALFLFPFALKTGNLKNHLQKPKKELAYVLISGLFFFAHLWTFFYASQNTRIANCMIFFAVNPLFVAALSYAFLKEKLSPRLIFAYIFAAIGVYALFSHSLSLEPKNLAGDISALISAFLFAIYLVTGKMARATVSNSEYTFIAYLLTAILFGASGLLQGQQFLDYNQLTWLAIFLSILFPTLLGHVLFSYLMKRMNLNFMSCGKLLEPALSSLLAYKIFQEELTSSATWAFTFTAIAVIILFVPLGSLSFLKSRA